MKKLYIRTDKYILRTIEGNKLLFPIKSIVGKKQGAILINEISLNIWDLLKTPKTIDEILKNIIDDYDIDIKIAEKDINKLFLQFEYYDVIQCIEKL